MYARVFGNPQASPIAGNAVPALGIAATGQTVACSVFGHIRTRRDHQATRPVTEAGKPVTTPTCVRLPPSTW
jgi:hypothetical protein